MRNKNTTSTRMILYAIALFSLFISGFPAGNAPIVHAQEHLENLPTNSVASEGITILTGDYQISPDLLVALKSKLQTMQDQTGGATSYTVGYYEEHPFWVWVNLVATNGAHYDAETLGPMFLFFGLSMEGTWKVAWKDNEAEYIELLDSIPTDRLSANDAALIDEYRFLNTARPEAAGASGSLLFPWPASQNSWKFSGNGFHPAGWKPLGVEANAEAIDWVPPDSVGHEMAMVLSMGNGAIVNALRCEWNTVLIMRHDGYPDSRLFVYLHIQNDTAPIKIGRVYAGQYLGTLREPVFNAVCSGTTPNCEIDYVPDGDVCSKSFGRHLHLGFGAGREIMIDGHTVADLKPKEKYISTNEIANNSKNIVINGDFEVPVVSSNGWITYFAGESFGNWTVLAGSVDHKSSLYWQAADMGQSIDLNGDATGSLAQSLPTIPGREYLLRFALSGNPDTSPCSGAVPIKTMEVWWGTELVDTLTFDVTGHSRSDMGWGFHEYTIVATDVTTQLKFTSLTPSCYGPVLDMVSLQAYSGLSNHFQSSKENDGWVLESTETSGEGARLSNTGHLFVGDNPVNRQFRSILSFNTSGLPDTAVITGVTLQIKKIKHVGVDPFTTHGKLLADIRRGAFSRSAVLQAQDFQAPANRNAVMVLTNSSVPINGWYTLKLGAAYFNLINKNGNTQFRLRFQKDDDNDMVADYLMFYSGNIWAALRPVLVVEYYVP